MKTTYKRSLLPLFCAIALFLIPQSALAKKKVIDPQIAENTKHYIEIVQQKVSDYDVPNNFDFSPGKCKILWDEAVLSNKNNLLCLNLLLTTQHSYLASRGENTEERVAVVHKLIVFWVSNPRKQIGGETKYILTLIPSQKYYKKHGDSYGTLFNYPNDINKFDGIVIASDPISGKIATVSYYTTGSLTKIRRLTGKPLQDTIDQVESTLSGLNFHLAR